MINWIFPPIIDTDLFCDASDFSWGVVFETKPTGAEWSDAEKYYHVNEKELLTIFQCLKSFKSGLRRKRVKTFSDNTCSSNKQSKYM